MNQIHHDVPLAHSAFGHTGKPDPYARHVQAVRDGATDRADTMLEHYSQDGSAIREAVEAAAWYHDLGKLDPSFQAMLRGEYAQAGWDHIDAGVAHLRATKSFMAAWLVRAHHAPGLPNKEEHFRGVPDDRQLRGRRDDNKYTLDEHNLQIEHTNQLLSVYLATHESVLPSYNNSNPRGQSRLPLRLALSCLVDADHEDTAYFESGREPPTPLATRWAERSEALQNYISKLPKGDTDTERQRNERRSLFFNACRDATIQESLVSCKAPVGQGKTTAVTAFLLQRAIDNNLRRLIIVAPFTNILTQTARVLRSALVLDGENPDEIILEHHHRAEFDSLESRSLAVLWRAPIILTTAVSFFETLCAANPSRLRRFHAVPGSAIFLDEAHAALPSKLWPQNWRWIRELAENWGCQFVLASGSLARFWENKDLVGEEHARILPELVPDHLEEDTLAAEQRRICFKFCDGEHVLTVPELKERILEAKGPHLVILNTVQSAAVVAKSMRDDGHDVLHLSTALTPSDRARILDRVMERLKYDNLINWTLVATSCVEAGVDLSFRTAFRERFSVSSTIQVGGRVNRHGQLDEAGGGVVYDFALDDELTTVHPGAERGALALHEAISDDSINREDPADVVTNALLKELMFDAAESASLVDAEKYQNYQEVSRLGRVIDADTRFVVVAPSLLKKLEKHIPVSFRELLEGSVQLWGYRVKKLHLEPVGGYPDVYAWKHDYDPDFLGYMAGVLKEGAIPKEGVLLLY